MTELPDAETLYHHFFAGWIPPEDPRTPQLRSDLEQVDLEPGQHPRVLDTLTPEGRVTIETQLARTRDAALADFPALLNVSGDPGLDWLDALDAYATPGRLQELLRNSNPEKPDNPYLILCCESGSLIADILKQSWAPLRWIGDFPYFESCLFDLNTRLRIPVFHWAIKTLSGEERKPLKDKVAATLEFLQQG